MFGLLIVIAALLSSQLLGWFLMYKFVKKANRKLQNEIAVMYHDADEWAGKHLQVHKQNQEILDKNTIEIKKLGGILGRLEKVTEGLRIVGRRVR